jgi:hypothetical protein
MQLPCQIGEFVEGSPSWPSETNKIFGITIAQQWSTRFAVPEACKAMRPLLSPVCKYSVQ